MITRIKKVVVSVVVNFFEKILTKKDETGQKTGPAVHTFQGFNKFNVFSDLKASCADEPS